MIQTSQAQIDFAHELKQKLQNVRPALDAETLEAQFLSTFVHRFPGADESAAALFGLEFEHVPASVKIKDNPEVAPDAGNLEHSGV